MDVRILKQSDVHELLPMDECMDAMARTLEAAARGEVLNPLRTLVR